jgi:putative nucleotidyltransferase with HDIG domain
VDAEQQHAVRVARLAVSLDGWASWREDAFAAGLLHDVGRLLLAARLGADYGEIHSASRSTGVPIHVLERDQLGTDHAGVGGHLLAMWGLPPVVVDAVARHHDASLARGRDLDAVLAVHVADRLDRAVGSGGLEALVEREASHDARWLTWAERAFALDRSDEAA